MILGTVMQELEPNKKYRVRVYNNKPFRDDKYEGLVKLYETTFDQQGALLNELNNLNADARISDIEDEIRQLEGQGGLQATLKIQDLVNQIQQIEIQRGMIRERYEEVTKNQYQVENELRTKIYRSPEYYDYDCYCAAYEKFVVGSEVGIVCDGYNTSEAVILPAYFRKGYGTHLTSQHLFNTWTWFYYYVMTAPLHERYATHYKANIYKKNEDGSFNIFMNTYEDALPDINFQNVPAIYIQGSEIPYFAGDDVLVYVGLNEDKKRVPKIIGFWQEPMRPFTYDSETYTFKQGYILEGSERVGDKYKNDIGSRFSTLPAADVFSRLSGYSSINNYTDQTLFMGYLLSRRGGGGAIINTTPALDYDGRQRPFGIINDLKAGFSSSIDPFVLLPITANAMRGIDEPGPYICNGVEYKRYIYFDQGNDYYQNDDRRILFNPQYRGWTNYIYKLQDGYAYLRNGGAVIGWPEEDCEVLVNFNDGNGSRVRNWLDTDVQQLFDDICYHNQTMIDSLDDPTEMYLYNRTTGQHYNDFKSFYLSQLNTHLFYEGAKYVNETEKRVNVYDLPKISGLYDAVNSRTDTPQGGVPNIQNHKVFFVSNYDFQDYSSSDPEVVNYIAQRCNPYRFFQFKVEDGMLIKGGTIIGEPNDIVVTSNRSEYTEYNTGQNFGYVYNRTKTYKYIHDFDYRRIQYINI